jgi:acetyl esterase/lipase
MMSLTVLQMGAGAAVALVFLMSGAAPARAQGATAPLVKQTLLLWPDGAPGALGTGDEDKPSMTVFPAPAEKANGAAVLVCPGGGYGVLAAHEGAPVAEWLNTLGITGVVLKYRLGPRYHHPAMLNDVSRGLRMIRYHAREWGLDPDRIGVMGFSAGGHLASTLLTHFTAGDPAAPDPVDRVSSRPTLGILVYPVITLTPPYAQMGSRDNLLGNNPPQDLVDFLSSEKQVTAQTPPTFLVCNDEDTVVPCENSLLFALALRKAHVPVELHLYEKGQHGYGMAGNDPVLSDWPRCCEAWLQYRKFIK